MKFKRLLMVWLGFFLLLADLSGSEINEAASEKMVPFTIPQLSAAADLVVYGTVEQVTSKRDQRKRIYTEIIINVLEGWKGKVSPGLLKVVQGGGTLGAEKVDISGQANFEPGEEVVLFLILNKRKEPVVYAMSQGKFRVQAGASGKTASNPFHGAFQAKVKATATGKSEVDEFSGLLDLMTFKEKIQNAK